MPNFSTTPLFIYTENIAVSVIIAMVGVFGLVSNGTAILATQRNPALRNSFGLLCFSHSSANTGVLLIFVFWTTPMILLESQAATELTGKVFGLVSAMLWNVCVYSHLAISLNRVIAIVLPIQASFLLTVKHTSFVVLICWMLGFCHIVPYFWTESCFMFLDTVNWTWRFPNTPCGHTIFVFINFYTSLSALILIVLLDCTTLICLKVKQTVNDNSAVHLIMLSFNFV